MAVVIAALSFQTPIVQATANSFTASVTIHFTPSNSMSQSSHTSNAFTPSVTIHFTPSNSMTTTSATTSNTTTGTLTITITQTIVGVNSPSPQAFANAIGSLILPMAGLGAGMFYVYLFRVRGDFGITVMLGTYFLGCLIGMLRNGNVTANGVIPIAETAEAGAFLVTWLLAGGATRNG